MSKKPVNAISYIQAINKNDKSFYNRTRESDTIYNSFIVGRGFSLFKDTCRLANIANRWPQLYEHKEQHFQFMVNTIRPKNRFRQWPKPVPDEDIDLICRYYNCNIEKAKDMAKLLTNADLDDLKNKMSTGGRV